MKSKNKGFTLIEMIAVISIFTILLGILEPSVSSIFAYRAKKAVNSIGASLDKTKTEAMNRLVGEMKLEKRSDGYYISYIIDRGKVNGKENIKWNEDEEKIAPSKTSISYKVEGGNEAKEMTVDESLIITYDRATGAFLPLQSQNETYWDKDIFKELRDGKSIFTGGVYCNQIIVSGGGRTRIINLLKDTGKYEIIAG